MATTVTKAGSRPLEVPRVRRGMWRAGFGATLLVLGSAGTARADFEPAIRVGIAHTDNVTLATVAPEAETVLQLSPSFSFAKQAPRLTANAAYRLEAFRFQQREDSNVFHTFDGALSTALDKDNFFLNFGASRTQGIRDPELTIPRGNLPISTNRVDRDEYYAGPSLQYPIGAGATASASFSHAWIRYRQDANAPGRFRQDFENDTASFSLNNYRRESGFTWAARYDSNETDYELFPNWKFRQASIEIGGWVSPGFRLFASGGRESAWDKPFDASLEDPFWEAGFATRSGERFSAEAAAGERTFGSSRRASLDVTFQRGGMSLSYAERPTTQGRDRYRNGLLSPDLTEDLLTRPGTAERYIAKRLQWNGNVDLRRTGIALTLFDENRERRTNAAGDPLPDQKQSGASVSFSWRAGRRTNLSLSARHNRRELRPGERRDFRQASLTARYDLGSRTDLSLEYAHSAEDSQGNTGGRDYSANLVSLLLTRTF